MDNEELERITQNLRELAQELAEAQQAESARWVLALDQGGHASRALVFDTSGREILQAFAPITTLRTGERVEHDPHEMIESLRTVIDDVAQSLGADVDRLMAAGLATQRSSIVCWDRHSGAALTPILSWQDRRNAQLTDALHPQRERIQDLTGLVLSPHYGASKLRWCLDEVVAVQQAREQQRLAMGPLASFILYSLLEARPLVADPANASRMQLWDPATRDWSAELLQLFGVPLDALPQCVPTRHAYGELRIGHRTLPLTLCTGDQAAAPFARGALQRETIYLNLGTGAFLLVPSSEDATHAAPYLRSVLWSDDVKVIYALEGTVNGAGSALDWLNERIGIDTHRAARSLNEGSLQHTDVPIFINGVSGVGSPFWLPHLESRFLGAGDETAKIAAVLESIAFLIAANLEGLAARQPRLKQIQAGGGLSESNYLCQCIADLSGYALARSGERELTAKGLAFLIAEQPDNWRAAPAGVSFAAKEHRELTTRYRRWREVMSAL